MADLSRTACGAATVPKPGIDFAIPFRLEGRHTDRVSNQSKTMKPKSLAAILFLACSLILPLAAKDDVPRGYQPFGEFKEAQAKAAGKKLVVLVVKGMDDACPNCAEAMENGERAVGSGVVKLFARAESIGKEDVSELPAVVQQRIRKAFTSGAYVTFVVFNPDLSEIVAEAGRKELQNDKKATAEFKKKVQAARKALK